MEAGLTWTIGKSRREACDFLGGEVNIFIYISAAVQCIL